jgi:hypothetical protein
MDSEAAEKCMRNVCVTFARLISLDGYLFVSGIDLDIRTKIARFRMEAAAARITRGDPLREIV